MNYIFGIKKNKKITKQIYKILKFNYFQWPDQPDSFFTIFVIHEKDVLVLLIRLDKPYKI